MPQGPPSLGPARVLAAGDGDARAPGPRLAAGRDAINGAGAPRGPKKAFG